MKIRASRNHGAITINIWLRPRREADLGIRIGRNPWPLFSERNQGTRGIPVRWHYAFGRRIAVRTR